MNYKTILTNLYFLLVHSDGDVNEKEVSVGSFMCQHEGIKADEFSKALAILAHKDKDKTYNETVQGMRQLKRDQQIKCIAWLCILANADGFMDKTEWKFIYKLYCTDLKLPLDEVLGAQKELNRARPHFSAMVAAPLLTVL